MIILILLVIAATFCYYIRDARRPNVPGIALVPRSPDLNADIYAWNKQQHYTFAQRHTVNFDRPQPARVVAPTDYLAPYWPKDMYHERYNP